MVQGRAGRWTACLAGCGGLGPSWRCVCTECVHRMHRHSPGQDSALQGSSATRPERDTPCIGGKGKMGEIIGLMVGTCFCWFCALVLFALGRSVQNPILPACLPDVNRADIGIYCTVSSGSSLSEAITLYVLAGACFLLPFIVIYLRERVHRADRRFPPLQGQGGWDADHRGLGHLAAPGNQTPSRRHRRAQDRAHAKESRRR
jgi:hypothetical protein